jgi:hypothetical protein
MRGSDGLLAKSETARLTLLLVRLANPARYH